MTDHTKANIRVLFALTLVHFTGDLYASFINPLLPVFADTFSLSLAQVGLLAGVSRFLMFIVQPVAGYLADHYRTRLFVLGGPILSMIFIPLVGVAPSFLVLVLFIVIGSTGQAMFHPPVAGMIATYAGRHFSFAMSVFNMGGTLAFGVGPLIVTAVVAAYGIEGTLATAALGLPLLPLIFRLVPRPEGEGLASRGFFGSIREALGGAWRSVANVWVVMVLRAFVSQSFITFIPMLYSQEGYSLVEIGLVVSLFTLAGSASGLCAGHTADRIGYKPVFLVCNLLAAPVLLLSVIVRGPWVYPCAFLAGFFSMATLPLGVAMAQELAPKGRSMVSSLMMGLALGTGGILSPVVGALADRFGITAVLSWLPVVPLASMILAARLPAIGGFKRREAA
jgi:FSR family fosmidomycin resistance protein-like MFS transporter